MASSLFEQWIERTASAAASEFFRSDRFKGMIRKHVKWAAQGFWPGYGFKERKAFTATVSDRLHQKARRPIYLLGRRIWRARMRRQDCDDQAEVIVTEFLDGDGIKFGDPAYSWTDGHDLADEDMSYWET